MAGEQLRQSYEHLACLAAVLRQPCMSCGCRTSFRKRKQIAKKMNMSKIRCGSLATLFFVRQSCGVVHNTVRLPYETKKFVSLQIGAWLPQVCETGFRTTQVQIYHESKANNQSTYRHIRQTKCTAWILFLVLIKPMVLKPLQLNVLLPRRSFKYGQSQVAHHTSATVLISKAWPLNVIHQICILIELMFQIRNTLFWNTKCRNSNGNKLCPPCC